MKIVVSPAKSLNFEDKLPTSRATQPQFLEQAEKLNKKLSTTSTKEIQDLMHISEKLADLNFQRYQDFTTPFTQSNARPAVFTFNGDVYNGLDAYSLPEEKMDQLQDTLRILSGMYGILRPLDLMQAYRLEMGTKLEYDSSKNLYQFWGETLTNKLNEELKDIISFFAKKARGSMVRYIIDKDINSIDGLKGFDYDGYAYSATESNEDKNEFVFTR